jgi:anti-sigma regulatory factor (Ser/Thr protein kinase)
VLVMMFKEYSASLDKLYEILLHVKEQAEKLGFEEEEKHKIELAMEEAIVNIITHGFKHQSISGTITIQCIPLPGEGLKIVIQDDGIAFDPMKYVGITEIEIAQKKEKNEPGGYGLWILVNMMDDVNYSYQDGKNILTLFKALKKEKTSTL